jgi:hypothetical protein
MTDMIFKTDGEEKFRIPSNKLEIPDSGYLKSPGTVCPKTPLHIREMTSKETIQQLKEDIAVLQEKLKKLEELEIHKSKNPAEKAFYRVYGYYPEGCVRSVWIAFQKGYEVAHKDAVENNKNFEPTSQEQENNEWRNVALRFGEELVSIGPCGYYDMTADDWLEWAKGAYEELVNRIEDFLPDEFDPNGSVYEYEIGWNEAIQSIKEKLR